jgi:hypothetical protein
MVRDEFYNINKEILIKVQELLLKKGKSYQTNDDILSNFKDLGIILGMSKYQVWSIYFYKHIFSLINSIKENPYSPASLDEIESLESRITDLIAYLLLFNAMIKENQK